MKRRSFIEKTAVIGASIGFVKSCKAENKINKSGFIPTVISTWDFGERANVEAWKVISSGGSALNAVEQGVRLIEADPEEQTVGIGGFPDKEGHVTLDACIMDHDSNCGSVCFLRGFVHPISIARKVMEDTPHIMLVGEGAKKFALEKGFEEENLLTEKSKKAWEKWLSTSDYKNPKINIENHDTISMLAIDQNGKMAGVCTTSGAAWKMHGRVGDSPLIGAGLFLDGEVGGACATGLGEAVIRTAGSAMVVEAMRHGASPVEACRQIVNRIRTKHTDVEDLQVGFLAMDKLGNYGGYSIHKGFSYAVHTFEGNVLSSAESLF
ncbi:MAG: N(4)-(beta-N-acetylglucosaminyl)-L-asparaginase [Saprospiraceae bacterium]